MTNTAKESAELRAHLGYQVQMLSLRLSGGCAQHDRTLRPYARESHRP